LTVGDSNNLNSTLSSDDHGHWHRLAGEGRHRASRYVRQRRRELSAPAAAFRSTPAQLRIGNGLFSSSATTPISVASGAELQYSGNGGSVFNDPISGAGVFHLVRRHRSTDRHRCQHLYRRHRPRGQGPRSTSPRQTCHRPAATSANAGGTLLFDQSTSGTFSGVMSNGQHAGGTGNPNDMSCDAGGLHHLDARRHADQGRQRRRQRRQCHDRQCAGLFRR
jgi:hypothetical protein